MIQDDRLAARKAKDAVKASLLTTLFGEISMVGKNAGRDTTDEEGMAVIKKFLKGNAENEKYAADQQNPNWFTVLHVEKAILESYLPKQMNAVEIQASLERLPAFDNKGVMMKYLKDNFAGQYDGKLAAQVIDKMLAK